MSLNHRRGFSATKHLTEQVVENKRCVEKRSKKKCFCQLLAIKTFPVLMHVFGRTCFEIHIFGSTCFVLTNQSLLSISLLWVGCRFLDQNPGHENQVERRWHLEDWNHASFSPSSSCRVRSKCRVWCAIPSTTFL